MAVRRGSALKIASAPIHSQDHARHRRQQHRHRQCRQPHGQGGERARFLALLQHSRCALTMAGSAHCQAALHGIVNAHASSKDGPKAAPIIPVSTEKSAASAGTPPRGPWTSRQGRSPIWSRAMRRVAVRPEQPRNQHNLERSGRRADNDGHNGRQRRSTYLA